MTRPNFFLVGAPRCGTTAMAKYLGQHSSICFSKPKEPHFLSQPPREDTPENLLHEYLDRHFSHRQAGQTLGEGSVSYLYSPAAIDLALEFNPNAQFLVMVRSPIDLVHSIHERHLYTMDEDIEDLQTAWNLQEARARGQHIPATCREAQLLQYRDLGRLGEAVAGLFERAGRDRCHVVVFDDFVADPSEVYSRVIAFLGLENDHRKDFSPVRTNRKIRSRFIQRMLRSPDPRLMKLVGADRIKGPPTNADGTRKKKPLIKRIRNRLIRRNMVVSERHPLDESMRRILVETFQEDIARLGQLLNRDLSPWLEGKRLAGLDGGKRVASHPF